MEALAFGSDPPLCGGRRKPLGDTAQGLPSEVLMHSRKMIAVRAPGAWIATSACIDGWMDGWMDAWMDGCMDGCMEWLILMSFTVEDLVNRDVALGLSFFFFFLFSSWLRPRSYWLLVTSGHRHEGVVRLSRDFRERHGAFCLLWAWLEVIDFLSSRCSRDFGILGASSPHLPADGCLYGILYFIYFYTSLDIANSVVVYRLDLIRLVQTVRVTFESGCVVTNVRCPRERCTPS